MENKLLHTPEGVRDSYGEEHERKLELELRLHKILKDFGYRDIETPSFEYFDVFANEIGTTPSNELYKFFDQDNNTLVLRSDFTPGVARAAAKYFLDEMEAVKLSYVGNVFSNSTRYRGKLKEVKEIGAECMGDGSALADAEMIRLSVELLNAAGLSDFQICIGNAGYFQGLSKEAGLDEKTENSLKDAIANKTSFAAEDILDEAGIKGPARERLLSCINCYGGEEVLKEALNGIQNETARKAVSRLQEVYGECRKTGIDRYISFDLGMLSKYNYYTGIIFRAFTSSFGEPVIKGGRYDSLLAKFGKDRPAIGLTLCLDDVFSALALAGRKEGDGYLTIALTKGRLADKTMARFEEMGIACLAMQEKESRKLIFVNEEKKLRFFLAKGPDVPTYVEYGAADIGIVGKDTILEENRKIYEVLDLGIGKCRMCICGPKEAAELLKHHEMIRVATKYPRITKDYFQNHKHQTVDIIKLNGSIELAPIVGLSEVICDIVETGATLRENGLEVLEEVCPLSARMVVNRVSMRLFAERIREITEGLKEVIKK
ncbi:MAG: ATP phosphoribosyltransferase regulatory subunit [Lachnospiraceae bacterium]|nr:ATP phosphoribosyltransferase regulatory subunit [Lachnospiraceae bacterium]